MNIHDFQAAIFDMDGVLTQTAQVHARAWKRMFDEYFEQRGEREGRSYEPFDADVEYRRYVDGKPRYDGVRSFLASRGIELAEGHPEDSPDRETVCGLGNRKNELFHAVLDKDGVEVYDDAVEQIAAWRRAGWKLAVISSSRNCEEVLRTAGLLDSFDVKVDGNDLARLGIPGKPAPDMFLRAAEELGIEPTKTIVVEDALAGVQAGRAGGFGLVVGVARDCDAEPLRRAGADRVVGDLRELETKSDAPISALEQTAWIAERLRSHELALFLDYDGTLTPIVRRPEEAILTEEMRGLLRELAGRCTVAIVSGRDRRDVEQMVGVPDLVYAGSHGFDIRGPKFERHHEQAQEALPELDAAERELCAEIEPIPGARVERKRFAIAVHYREVENESDWRRIEEVVDQARRKHAGLRKMSGKKIFELQPDVEWDKGRAVLWLTEALGMDRSDVVVIYIGDDVTDEDAFRALRQHGGIGVRVGLPESGETSAKYSLDDCDQVQQFLNSLLENLQEKDTTQS